MIQNIAAALGNISLTPDMAEGMCRQFGINEPHVIDLMRTFAGGGFSKPSIEPMKLLEGCERTLPTEGTALVITTQNPKEKVTMVITRESLGTNVVDIGKSP